VPPVASDPPEPEDDDEPVVWFVVSSHAAIEIIPQIPSAKANIVFTVVFLSL
jgi:hypothetical protein